MPNSPQPRRNPQTLSGPPVQATQSVPVGDPLPAGDPLAEQLIQSAVSQRQANEVKVDELRKIREISEREEARQEQIVELLDSINLKLLFFVILTLVGLLMGVFGWLSLASKLH